MRKSIHKYDNAGKYVCTYKSIQQAANDIGCNESSIRKKVNSKDFCRVKGNLLSFRRCDNILGEEKTKAILNHKANILLIDIETAPTIAGIWRFWKQNINYDQIFDNSYILSYSCKWLLETDIYSSALTPQEAIMNDDSRLVYELWRWLDSADIVIAHNGKMFDLPTINTRMIQHRLLPMSSYIIIDTLDAARKFFNFPSNKLESLAKYLGLTPKIENEGFKLWAKCIHGDEDALREMEAYNRGDVITLEDVYMAMRAYIKPHPNMGLFVDGEVRVCPTCGSSDIESNGYYYTPMNKYSEFRCKSCGASGRSRFAEKKFNNMLSSTSH